MINKIIEFIFGTKKDNLKKEIDTKYKEAISFQRNGNIRKYSLLMAEIKEMEDKYERL